MGATLVERPTVRVRNVFQKDRSRLGAPGVEVYVAEGNLVRTSVAIYEPISTHVSASVSEQGPDGTLPKTPLRTKQLKTKTRRNYGETQPCKK